jgi:hypothetical protein
MSGEIDNQEVMPAGAMPPEPKPAPEPEQEPVRYAGKFESPEELASAYSELEKKLGEQGQELGTQREMARTLMEQLQQTSGQAKTPPTEPEAEAIDYDAQMQELMSAVEEGDLSIGEALMKSSQLSAQMAERNALSKYDEISRQKALQQTQQQFYQANPDFEQVQASGALEAIKGELPGLHDDFSAYYAYKAQQAAQQAAQKQETARIAEGDVRTEKVLQKPGTQAKNIGKKQGKMSDYDLKQSMLARLS